MTERQGTTLPERLSSRPAGVANTGVALRAAQRDTKKLPAVQIGMRTLATPKCAKIWTSG